jgi:hypothetical protein
VSTQTVLPESEAHQQLSRRSADPRADAGQSEPGRWWSELPPVRSAAIDITRPFPPLG